MFGNSKASIQADIEELQLKLDESVDRVETLMEENDDLKKTISSFVGVKAMYESQMEKMQEECDIKVNEMKAQMVITEKSVNQKVNESLASIGVSTFPNETIISPSTSPAEKLERFQSLQGVERTEYYKQNEASISQALGISTITKR